MLCGKTALRLWARAAVFVMLSFLCLNAVTAWATPAATTTTLTTGSKTVNSRTITTLTAIVTPTGSTTALTQGLVQFKDGKVLLGTAQIVNAGTKFTHGAAYLSVELGAGTHSLTAVFAGRVAYATSTSAAASVVLAGGSTSTTITSTGAAGAYTLTGQVIANGASPITGNVNFVDQTAGNATVATEALGTATSKRTYAGFSAVPVYDPVDNNTPMQAVIADLNGDGILDLLDVDYSEAVSVHMGKGDGTFMAAQSYCMDTSQTPAVPCDGGYEPTSIAIADFNSDGIPDLVFASWDYVVVALGKGDGTFQLPVHYNTQGNTSMILVADLNRDGKPDIIGDCDGGISILLGNGNGTFQPHTEVAFTAAGTTYITLGDFNKDGLFDIAAAGWNGGYLMVRLGNGDGTFQAEKDTAIDINVAGCNIAAADFKNSGYFADIVMCGSGALETLAGNGNGTFAAPATLYPNAGFDEYVNWVTPVDMNGDGNVDLVLAWDSSDTDVGRIGIFNGASTGIFNATPTTVTAGKKPVFLTAADLNGNGAPDLVTANDTDNNLSVILQSATSTATASISNVSLPGTGNQSVVAQYAGDTHYTTSTSSAITLQGSGGTASVTISTISPATAVAGSAAFTLTVNGTGFASGAVVKWNGAARTTAFVSSTKVTAAITAADVATAGNYAVTVTVGSSVSNSVNFSVTTAGAKPTVTSIAPNFVYRGAAALTMTVNGTNFASGSIVYWGSTQLVTTFVSATKLTAAVPAANLAALGTFQITVSTNGAVSNAMPFTVAPNTHLPLAYGFFNKDATAGATSGNITCTWTSPTYLCTITGEDFYFSKYVVNATIGDTNTPAFITVNSIGGKVLVKIYNPSGTAIQAPFNMVVFKP